jgi:hypothetical protein
MIQHPRLAFGNFILLFYGKFGLLVTQNIVGRARSEKLPARAQSRPWNAPGGINTASVQHEIG